MKAPRIKKVVDQNIIKTINDKKQTPVEYRKEEIYKEPLHNNVHTIQGISIDDIDGAVIQKIKEILSYNKDKKISIYDFSRDRFNEIVQSWENKTKDDSYNLPFVNISRDSTPKRGTKFNNISYNIPGNELYRLIKVPIKDSTGLTQYEHYQVPQPTSIDLDYEINIISNTLKEINTFDEKMLLAFKSAQLYVKVNGYHYMPLTIDNDAQDKGEDAIDKRRFYSHTYNITLKGYIIPQEEIKMVKSAKNMKLNVKLSNQDEQCFTDTNVFKKDGNECLLSLNFFFKKRSENEQFTVVKNNLELYSDNLNNATYYDLFVNGVEQSIPVNVNIGDELKIINTSGLDKNLLVKLYAREI